ncbi:MAG: sigma-70 family RNA polymerase sigma factor [Thermoleophilia bacterium]|nr:sigma-70 family RNA polymerase sigma factor [Thermoleophilia bacterium]
MSDEVMSGQARGDATLAAIEQVYRRDLERFLRVAAALLGDRDAARDAVQEGFAHAVARRDTYSGRGPLEAWVWRVVVNRARNYRRDRGAPTAPLERELVDVAATNGARETGALRAALAALPERQRLVVFLHYFADLDYPTIAGALDIRQGTVAATLNAARTNLRRALEQEVPQQ